MLSMLDAREMEGSSSISMSSSKSSMFGEEEVLDFFTLFTMFSVYPFSGDCD